MTLNVVSFREGKIRFIILIAKLLDYLGSAFSTGKLVSILSAVVVSRSILGCGRQLCGMILLLLCRGGGARFRRDLSLRCCCFDSRFWLHRCWSSSKVRCKVLELFFINRNSAD
ncbi:hypothetical protein EUGRSUZ_I00002 [Eucalyptus grandis]|uniref:Uncharacterized protein n=2 Tax=Eucalyptus grandis TaxID=71139 RepID=A0ACC3JCJ1_EUCGR|nr:hypothetical protein EUGRSUZ_I00002 [Eucalyptus grandis]